MTSIVVEEIKQNRFKEDKATCLPVSSLASQPEITVTMLQIVVGWMYQVNNRIASTRYTHHLSVSILFRFVTTNQVKKSHLQLVALACMYIANEYNENFPVSMSDFVYMCENTYTSRQISRTVNVILKACDYQILLPTTVYFIDLYWSLIPNCKDRDRAKQMCYYLQTLALLSFPLYKYPASEIAFCIVYLVREWSDLNFHMRPIRRLTFYSSEVCKECLNELTAVLVKYKPSKSQDKEEIHNRFKEKTKGLVIPDVIN